MSKLENEALYGLLLEVYILIVSPVFSVAYLSLSRLDSASRMFSL